MSSFIHAVRQPVMYGAALGGKFQTPVSPPAAAHCYYGSGCSQTGVQDAFYGAAVVNQGRCYGDYDGGAYGQQRGDGYGGRYGQMPPHQQQRMFMSEYQAHDAYRGYCTQVDQPPHRSGPPSVYGGEELARPAGDSPSSGVVPASSPASAVGPCAGGGGGYSPPSAPLSAAVAQRVSNLSHPPVIYPWMKMVHSVSGELFCSFWLACIFSVHAVTECAVLESK